MTPDGVRPSADVAWQSALTDHELAVLRLLARGRTHTQIADLLKVSPETAGGLLHRAQTLLGARTLPHAVAYETGLLGRPVVAASEV